MKKYQQIILPKFFFIFRKLHPFSSKILIFFEPVIPFLISLLLRRILDNLKSEGNIDAFFLKITRFSRYNYNIKVRFILTLNQINRVALDLINKIIEGLKHE